jgi:hypothetical protein
MKAPLTSDINGAFTKYMEADVNRKLRYRLLIFSIFVVVAVLEYCFIDQDWKILLGGFFLAIVLPLLIIRENFVEKDVKENEDNKKED